MKIKKIIKKIIFFFKRLFLPTLQRQIDSKSLTPISSKFGFDFGTPIDRVYTNDFLAKNSHHIKGIVCEIAENTYTREFGKNVVKSEILHVDPNFSTATIIGDLTNHKILPKNYLDCFIATVTLNFIYDYKKAIQGIHQMLKGGGGCID